MMCTGYLHSYPFLRLFVVIMIIIIMIMNIIIIINIVLKTMFNREDLRMKSRNLLYPAGMYKGMVWTAGNLVVFLLDVLLLLMFFFLMLLFFLLLKLLLLLNLSKPFWHVHVQGHGVASR